MGSDDGEQIQNAGDGGVDGLCKLLGIDIEAIALQVAMEPGVPPTIV